MENMISIVIMILTRERLNDLIRGKLCQRMADERISYLSDKCQEESQRRNDEGRVLVVAVTEKEVPSSLSSQLNTEAYTTRLFESLSEVK